MEENKNIKEEIKVQIDSKKLHKESMDAMIYKYSMIKYKNVLNEIILIKEILEACREDDEEIRQEYLSRLQQLENEKIQAFNKIQEIDEQEGMEK